MSHDKKVTEFLKAVEKAGLNEAFGKMCTIASKTIGVYLDDILDDFVYFLDNPKPDLKPSYRVCYQDRWMKERGDQFWVLENQSAIAAGKKGWVAQHTFPTYDLAKAALDRKIRECNRGAHVDTMVCGGIGMDIVVDEETAKSHQIIHWKIQKQFKSVWEIEESQ